MTFLATVAFLTIPYIVVFLLILGLGIGAGYLLQWLLGIDLDAAIISGMIVASASIYFALRTYSLLPPVFDDDPIDEEGDESPVIYVTNSLPMRKRRKRKRK